MTDAEKIRILREEYFALAHAMQSGVAQTMELDRNLANPAHGAKHLRVGVNSAMVEHGGLIKLLIDKGLVTELEYMTCLRDAMKQEVQRFQEELSGRLGIRIHLA